VAKAGLKTKQLPQRWSAAPPKIKCNLRVFPRPVKPAFFARLSGRAEAVPFPKTYPEPICCEKYLACLGAGKFSITKTRGNLGSNKWSTGDCWGWLLQRKWWMAANSVPDRGNLHHRGHRGHGGIFGVTSGTGEPFESAAAGTSRMPPVTIKGLGVFGWRGEVDSKLR